MATKKSIGYGVPRAKRRGRHNLPGIVYVWRNEDGIILASDDLDELQHGDVVGTYVLESCNKVEVTTALIAPGGR